MTVVVHGRPEAVTRLLDEERNGRDNHERNIQAIMSMNMSLDK